MAEQGGHWTKGSNGAMTYHPPANKIEAPAEAVKPADLKDGYLKSFDIATSKGSVTLKTITDDGTPNMKSIRKVGNVVVVTRQDGTIDFNTLDGYRISGFNSGSGSGSIRPRKIPVSAVKSMAERLSVYRFSKSSLEKMNPSQKREMGERVKNILSGW